MESILNALSGTTTEITVMTAFLYTLMAGLLGLLVSVTYQKTSKDQVPSVNFARSLIVLPMLVCVVMTMVNGNLGTSVAIVGAFSLIRFRSLQGSSRDITYVFFVMAIGLTLSVGYLGYAVLITLVICLILLLLSGMGYGEAKSNLKHLKITLPEDLDYSDIFNDIFEKYAKDYRLYKVKTTNMGSLYELSYSLILKDAAEEKAFIDAIRVRNGNLNVTLGETNRGEEL